MENEKLLQMIEELQAKIVHIENGKNANRNFWDMAFSKIHVVTGVLISALVTSVFLYAAELVVFTDGTVISAEEVNSNFSGLDGRLKELETAFNGVTRSGNVIQFSGVNLQIVSGSGKTDGTVNGLGNLIIGYNESNGDTRTGSHNLIVGPDHSYSSYGGFVAGANNTISNVSATVSGGGNNTISGPYSSISGGLNNSVSGYFSSISGGAGNAVSGPYSSICGGNQRTASGGYQVLP